MPDVYFETIAFDGNAIARGPAPQIGDLFERRWEGEVATRSIKHTMQMDVLRWKTPAPNAGNREHANGGRERPPG